MPRVPRGVALLLAVVVIAAATVYSVAWMYYAGREPVARLGVNPQHRATTGGLLLVSVEPGTRPSVQACRPGDRILEINGRRLDTPNPFYDAVTRGRPGDRVTMRVERDPIARLPRRRRSRRVPRIRRSRYRACSSSRCSGSILRRFSSSRRPSCCSGRRIAPPGCWRRSSSS